VNLGNRLASQTLKKGQANHIIWFGYVDQVMRRTLSFIQWGLGGANIHTPVEQARVGRDNLTTQTFSQLDGNLCLTDGGWAEDHDQRVKRGHS
jgi:hypothetical protein